MAETSKIRNVALIGHRGAGKTSLTEALLHAAGVTNRMGAVTSRNTITDFDQEEQNRQLSISCALASFEYQGYRINLLDTPGYADFLGDTYGALRVADAAIVVIHAESGVEVETLKTWQFARREFGLPALLVVNHLDGERARLDELVDGLGEALGTRCPVLQVPIGEGSSFSGVVDLLSGKAYSGDSGAADPPAELADAVEAQRAEVVEFAAESDESLMDKFFESGELSPEEIASGLKMGVGDNSISPVLLAAATKNVGVVPVLQAIVGLLPAPSDRPAVVGVKPNTEEAVERQPSADEPFSGYVFKALLGEGRKVALMRVYSGRLASGSTVVNTSQGSKERLGSVSHLLGDKLSDCQELVAGDIVGLVKVDAKAGDTLAADSAPVVFPPTVYPTPVIAVAVHPKSRGDEEKIGAGLNQLRDEDPSFRYGRNDQTGEMVLEGMGDMHLQVLLSKLANRFKVEVETTKPKVAYLETLRKKVEVQGRFKKQSGGAGQFGDCWLRVEPLPRGSGFEFADEIFGGSVPKQYIPSVEKGVRERLSGGYLVGAQIVDIKVALYDGSYHSVDSSDIAFQLAGRAGLEKAFEQSGVYLLEPILDIWVTVPDDYVGDIMADLPRRRGTVMGSEGASGLQTIQAQVPAAEMATYATDLRSITQGRGSFRVEFSRYEEVPGDLADKIVAEYKAAAAQS